VTRSPQPFLPKDRLGHLAGQGRSLVPVRSAVMGTHRIYQLNQIGDRLGVAGSRKVARPTGTRSDSCGFACVGFIPCQQRAARLP